MNRKEVQEELTRLVNMLRRERDEDLKQYNQKIKNTSITEQRKQGVCWFPVRLDRSSFSSAERPMIKVSRAFEHKDSHQFQSGKLVQLFSADKNNDNEHSQVRGVVNQVRDHEMIITLNANDTPDWVQYDKIGVQLLFDDNSYREMEQAVKQVLTKANERLEHLKLVLLGNVAAEFSEASKVNLPELNSSQNNALNKVLQAKDVAIIHGPPGTGKTTTLVQAIKETLRTETQVLVCAPSNAAVDLVAEKLAYEGVSVVRIGHPARVTEEMLSLTLDAKISKHNQYKELKTLRRSADEYKNLGHKYKRNFGRTEREQRSLLLAEAKRFRAEAEMLASYIKDDIIDSSRVIATTLVGAANFSVRAKNFDTVFIDEAAQGLEPACWIPILKASRIVFAGDHHQLPPTIKSFQVAKEGLSVTLFEKAIQRNQADVLLSEQYRMNTQIMGFSNRQFYNNQLIANTQVANRLVFPDDLAIEFIDTAGCGFVEETHPQKKSAFNREEMELLFKHLTHYIRSVQTLNLTDSIDAIGIISPYKAQVTLLQETYQDRHPLGENFPIKVNINTIDSFQGQERDIIYISLVRSNDKGEIGFLSDTRRMNVAMTRARKKLVIIGDSATIASHPYYNDFLDYINEVNAYRSAFEWMGE